MLLADMYIVRGETAVLISHVDYNLMHVKVVASDAPEMIGLMATIQRARANPNDRMLPQALFFDGCVRAAQFLELECSGQQEKLEEGIKLTIQGVDVLQLFPMYYKDKKAWGADGHAYVTQSGETEVFTLPIPEGNTWQNTVASVMVAPVLKLTLDPMTTYEDFTNYYASERAKIEVNNEIRPVPTFKLNEFEKRADAFATLLKRAKEWRPN